MTRDARIRRYEVAALVALLIAIVWLLVAPLSGCTVSEAGDDPGTSLRRVEQVKMYLGSGLGRRTVTRFYDPEMHVVCYAMYTETLSCLQVGQ